MEPTFEPVALEMATREFSRNPSKALRDADVRPVLVTKYGQPVACVVSVDQWNSMVSRLRAYNLDELTKR
jgi:prevent-host-death family protein